MAVCRVERQHSTVLDTNCPAAVVPSRWHGSECGIRGAEARPGYDDLDEGLFSLGAVSDVRAADPKHTREICAAKRAPRLLRARMRTTLATREHTR